MSIVDLDTPFSIANLSFTATSSDPGNLLGFTFAAGSFSYSVKYPGYQKGPDGLLGTNDDIVITSGNSALVNAIWSGGPANAFAILSGDAGATNQEKIDNGVQALRDNGWNVPVNFDGTFTLGAATGSGGVTIVPTPEPGSAILLLVGTGLLFAKRSRQKLFS